MITRLLKLAFVMVPIGTTKFFAGREVGWRPVASAVFNEEERPLAVNVALNRATDNGPRAR